MGSHTLALSFEAVVESPFRFFCRKQSGGGCPGLKGRQAGFKPPRCRPNPSWLMDLTLWAGGPP